MTDQKISVIKRQLHFMQRGGNWLEECFDKKLNNLKAELAFKQPVPGIHSVAEIVWHCAYWHKVNVERLTGNPGYRDATIEQQNFLPLASLKGVGWPSLKATFDTSFDDLFKAIEGRDDSFLENEYEPGKSFEFILQGTIEHDAYHLGQIGLVIKILKEAP